MKKTGIPSVGSSQSFDPFRETREGLFSRVFHWISAPFLRWGRVVKWVTEGIGAGFRSLWSRSAEKVSDDPELKEEDLARVLSGELKELNPLAVVKGIRYQVAYQMLQKEKLQRLINACEILCKDCDDTEVCVVAAEALACICGSVCISVEMILVREGECYQGALPLLWGLTKKESVQCQEDFSEDSFFKGVLRKWRGEEPTDRMRIEGYVADAIKVLPETMVSDNREIFDDFLKELKLENVREA